MEHVHPYSYPFLLHRSHFSGLLNGESKQCSGKLSQTSCRYLWELWTARQLNLKKAACFLSSRSDPVGGYWFPVLGKLSHLKVILDEWTLLGSAESGQLALSSFAS